MRKGGRALPGVVCVLLACATVCAACGATDIAVLAGPDAGAGGGLLDAGPDGPGFDGPGSDGPGSDASQTRTAYCAGSGPPTLVDDSDGGTGAACTGRLASTSFRYALCTCDGYVGDHALTTDAFDSTQGPYDPGHPLVGGSVGTNGTLNATGALTIGGSLWASDATPLTSTTVITALGELHAEGEVHSGPTLQVGKDAWTAGGIQTSGNVTIAGTLHIPASAPLSISGMRTIGAVANESVQVSPACDCAPGDLLDIAGFVETYRATNDDAAAGVDPAWLENVTSPLTATLPCGRIFLTRIGASAPVHLTAQGRVAVFVGGDLSTNSDFTIDVPAGSELDLFVEGGVVVGGAFGVGEASNPANARTYVGGTGSVNLQGAAQLAGNLYCPRAQLVLGGSAPTTVYGSIFAAYLNAGSDLTIHYDEAILGQASSSACAAPPTCNTCRDCGGQACNSGTCGGCTDSVQCCAPLVCVTGRCQATIQ
jgi:hypothetical protein